MKPGRALSTVLVPLFFLLLGGLALHHAERTPLASLRHLQFDHLQRLKPRERLDEPVVIVGIDSRSLAAHGQWPWSRSLLARLLEAIDAGQPLAIGIDILFAEADRQTAQDHHPDHALAATLARIPGATLASVGLPRMQPGSRPLTHPLPEILDPAGLTADFPRFAAALGSLPELQAAAAGEGFINASRDEQTSHEGRGILRQLPTLAFVGDLPQLSLPLEMVRQALGGGAVAIEPGAAGTAQLRLGDYRLPIQRNGDLLLHFGRSGPNHYLSATDVLLGAQPAAIFRDRFVIIGLNSTGLQDNVLTPLGETLPGVDIHAQVIESLLQQSALRRPAWLSTLELGALLLGGLGLIAWMPAHRPRQGVLAFLLLCAMLTGSGYLAFAAGHWLFDGMTPALLLLPVFLSLLAGRLIHTDRQLRRSRENAARIAGELDAARRIQQGLLPDPAVTFRDERRFALAARLEPALAVGGDYYDCFMLDARRLCLAIGDVSGKGLSASLFMAISKTLAGTLLRRHDDLGAAVRDIELALSRENPASLFVTAFIAVIDLDSGEMHHVCAGHDAPLLLRAGALSELDTDASGGPPLCALGDFPYQSGMLQLQRGDRLCLYTDGVSEANNGNAIFGKARLQATLRDCHQQPPADVVDRLLAAVRTFEAGQAPADDLTLLVFDWNGQPLSER